MTAGEREPLRIYPEEDQEVVIVLGNLEFSLRLRNTAFSLEHRTLEGEELNEAEKDKLLIQSVGPAILPFMQAVITRLAEGEDDREFGMVEAAYQDTQNRLSERIKEAKHSKVDEAKLRGLGEVVAGKIVTPEAARETALNEFNEVVDQFYPPEQPAK